MQVRELTRTIPKGKTKRKKTFMYIQRAMKAENKLDSQNHDSTIQDP
jgi:hypothetical protein